MVERMLISRRTVLLATLILGAMLIAGCSSPKQAPEGFQIVKLNGTDYTLELVADDATRFVGLGGREEIPDTGVMLFSFKSAYKRSFLMRDCLFDIDVLFLDAGGRIVAMHHMPIEDPRKSGELTTKYDARLKKYSSRFGAQFAIEIRGGLLETMDYSTGDKIELDLEYLKAVTQ